MCARGCEDPYTFEQRRFSGNNELYRAGDFRQDLGKFAWGATLSGSSDFAFYRQNEVDHFITNFR